jgi:hypothetical protein
LEVIRVVHRPIITLPWFSKESKDQVWHITWTSFFFCGIFFVTYKTWGRQRVQRIVLEQFEQMHHISRGKTWNVTTFFWLFFLVWTNFVWWQKNVHAKDIFGKNLQKFTIFWGKKFSNRHI